MPESKYNSLTLHDILIRVFPSGTGDATGGQRRWTSAPFAPADVFGVCAYLLDVTGAYAHFDPACPSDGCASPWANFTREKIRELMEIGAEWRQDYNLFSVPTAVQRRWRTLFKSAKEVPLSKDEIWRDHALELLIIADEASADVGYFLSRNESESADASWISELYHALITTENRPVNKTKNVVRPHSFSPSLCFFADTDVLCVQPKARTPQLGCSIRNFSHNLALLPPKGGVKTYWIDALGGNEPDSNPDALNLLLIPFPYKVSASEFKGEAVVSVKQSKDNNGLANGAAPWGNFDLGQSWLRDTARGKRNKTPETAGKHNVFRMVETLISEAERDCGEIHGVLFPEYSLNWDVFEFVSRLIMHRHPTIRFVVAGSSSNCLKGETKRRGNCVLTAIRQRKVISLPDSGSSYSFSDADQLTESSKPIIVATSRRKHHRWRLEKSQIESYALGSALDSRMNWWERLHITQRELFINTFGDASTFCALICEDLARTDPVHSVIKAIAPSMVFALLMDGAQIAERWSGRYALGLTEDPGSSVLTFTSLALVERTGITRPNGSRSVALWRDDSGRFLQLDCPKGSHALTLTLSEHDVKEHTIDGRPNTGAKAWRYSSHAHLTIPKTPATEDLLRWMSAP